MLKHPAAYQLVAATDRANFRRTRRWPDAGYAVMAEVWFGALTQ
jgi:hypothetical protein